ncbi:hypothetical protein [Rossellomorea arthrocnemi]|jgi:hypothetical protein|uniref:hypothetical protein n=1 Tax=Rossellomorea arthrocnemi TaxID=2769542 RepID=UPI001919BC59|nr:hypothetical protein [Rossellomorea arthrocnemi]
MTGHLFEHHKALKILDPKRQKRVAMYKVLESLPLNHDDGVAMVKYHIDVSISFSKGGRSF